MEQFICEWLLEVFSANMWKLPIGWFGTYNALALYCRHPAYCPSLPLPSYLSASGRDDNIERLIGRGIPNLEKAQRWAAIAQL